MKTKTRTAGKAAVKTKPRDERDNKSGGILDWLTSGKTPATPPKSAERTLSDAYSQIAGTAKAGAQYRPPVRQPQSVSAYRDNPGRAYYRNRDNDGQAAGRKNAMNEFAESMAQPVGRFRSQKDFLDSLNLNDPDDQNTLIDFYGDIRGSDSYYSMRDWLESQPIDQMTKDYITAEIDYKDEEGALAEERRRSRRTTP